MKVELTQSEWDYWYTRVYGFYFRRVDNKTDVEDLTAQVLTEVFLKEGVENLKGLMWVTARRRLIDYIRAKGRKELSVDISEREVESLLSTPSKHYKEKVHALIDCARNQLKEKDFDVVYKSILEDFNSKEIAEQLNIKAAAVRKRLSRALDKVRQGCRDIWVLPQKQETTV